MHNATAFALGLALGAIAIASLVGAPRLYATGCETGPSWQIAMEETDFPQCEHIAALPFVTE